jgi:hypothetical protein
MQPFELGFPCIYAQTYTIFARRFSLVAPGDFMAEHTIPVHAAKHGPKKERRAWVRRPISQEIACQPVVAPAVGDSDTYWLGKPRDISPVGLRMLLSHRVEPGTVLIIQLLAGKAKGTMNPMPVQVVHATEEKKGLWIMGCEFVLPLSKEELQPFVGD